MRIIYLIIAILALNLFGIMSAHWGLFSALPLDERKAIGFGLFATNLVVGIVGASTRYFAAWVVYILLSGTGFILMSASTPATAIWLASKLVR
jgi:hypothetical protein